MPVQSRPTDVFTRDNLLLGFSIVEFEPALTGGGYGAAVPLGILSSQTLQKTVETLQLPRGDAGLITIDRELVSRLEVNMQLQTFNFRSDIFQYIMAANALTSISANAAQAVTNDPFQIPTLDPERTFVNLSFGDIDETSFGGSSVTCAPIADEAVGTGDGTLGDASGDYSLDFKVNAVGDVTSITVGGVAYTPVAVSAAASGNEVEVTVGTGATSGDLQFFVGGVAANVTGAIVADYTPSFTFANLTDYVVDPLLGRIRMLNVDGATDKVKSGQNMLADYTYDRKASVSLQPFTKNQFDGRATIRHLPDVGVNFIWTIPSATIRITDDDLTFGAEDFATATLQLNINDAGGSNRFGTLLISSETESAA